ncbi:hypothetical protein QBC39DRAFT_353315 [Podospora conica]|nr:hypothetical protein QBC39DRAFT_353315 [Schizothecium conicum]
MSTSEAERSPLLKPADDSPSRQLQDADIAETSESTPLLLSSDATPRYDGDDDGTRNGDAASIASVAASASASPTNKGAGWTSPTIIAMAVLALFSLSIIIGAFFVPAAVEEYAKEALVLEPTNLSLESITKDGVRARIQANVRLDGQRVRNDHVRRIGRAATWLVRELGTEHTRVNVYLPEYNNILLGSAAIPPLTVNIVDGKNNAIDFVADLIPGDAEGVRTIANDWLEGRLDVLRLRGKADIPLRAAGFIPLGTHSISESLSFEANKLPKLPAYNITKIDFQEEPIPGQDGKVMKADVSITAFNEFPVSAEVPMLRFDILVPGCSPYDPYILVAAAVTSPVAVRPYSNVVVNAYGIVQELAESLTRVCPGSESSPLDHFFKKYMGGEAATVFVRGQKPADGTSDWLAEILSSIAVPVPFPGRSFDNLIRSFSLEDVHFTLPDPYAEPDDPDSNPKVTGTIIAIAAIPSEMNFGLNVTGVKADADVFYHNQKLGELNLSDKWQKANSTQYPASKDEEATLEIQSRIQDAPLNVTDSDVLTSIIQALLFGTDEIVLDIKAKVDVRVETVLGTLTVKEVPAEGKIPLKPIPRDGLGSIAPQVGNIEVTETTPQSLSIKATVNITNPTPYSAHIPYINIHVLCNGSLLGEAWARNLDFKTGHNVNLAVSAQWNPSLGGHTGIQTGRNLLSQYLSGYNTSITIKTHRNSIPALPLLGEALSKLNITVSAPKINLPGGDEDEKTHFIRDATFHIFSSTATFLLVSPLQHNTLYIERVNATALYNHTEPVGQIFYELPFAAPPGETLTPKLPVEWSLDSVGYERLKDAVGGKLKLDAKATVGVRLGRWTETVWYYGRGIGASVRL